MELYWFLVGAALGACLVVEVQKRNRRVEAIESRLGVAAPITPREERELRQQFELGRGIAETLIEAGVFPRATVPVPA